MIDHELRLLGCGGSDIGAILGVDPRRDAFSVYIEKTGTLPREDNPNPRQRRGHYFERGIADLYADITGQRVEWSDTTIQHPTREYQVATPDAWVLNSAGERIGIMDAKTAGLGAEGWGESGSDEVPEVVTLQGVWTASCAELPWWDACALVRHLDDVRIYRIWRDRDLEQMIDEAVRDFWYNHVIPRVPPRPGASDATKDALRRMYPRNVEPLRAATEAEMPLVGAFKAAYQEEKRAARVLAECRNQLIYCIGDAEGLLAGADRLTYKRSKDSMGVDYEAVARELGLRLELLKPIVEWALLRAATDQSDKQALVHLAGDALVRDTMPTWWPQTFEKLAAEHQVVTREGARKLIVPRGWSADSED